jgi:hypothetical protein
MSGSLKDGQIRNFFFVTQVMLEIKSFWYVTLCRLISVPNYRRFEGSLVTSRPSPYNHSRSLRVSACECCILTNNA